MEKKRFILWPVTHTEEVTEADQAELLKLADGKRVTFFFEYGKATEPLNELLSKTHVSDVEYDAAIMKFFDEVNPEKSFLRHNKSQLFLMRALGRGNGMDVVPMDYRLDGQNPALTETEDAIYYAAWATTSTIISNTYLNAQKELLTSKDAVKRLLVNKAFLICTIRRQAEIREKVMLDTIGKTLENSNGSTYVCIVGASHANAINEYLQSRDDVQAYTYNTLPDLYGLIERDKAELSDSLRLICAETFAKYIHDITEAVQIFEKTDIALSDIKFHYLDALSNALKALPDDKDLSVGISLAGRTFSDIVRSEWGVMRMKREHDMTIDNYINGYEEYRNLFERSFNAPQSVRLQTLSRVFRRFATAMQDGSWSGKEKELAAQIFRTEIESDARKLSRKGEKSKMLNA